jgi:hypothetical protein
MTLATVTCVPGFFAFGYVLSTGGDPYVISFCQGLLMFGVVIGIWSTISYSLDAYRKASSEIFVMIMTFKVRDQTPTLCSSSFLSPN